MEVDIAHESSSFTGIALSSIVTVETILMDLLLPIVSSITIDWVAFPASLHVELPRLMSTLSAIVPAVAHWLQHKHILGKKKSIEIYVLKLPQVFAWN